MSRSILRASAALGVLMLPLGAADAQPAFDWNGFYAGVHGGFLWGDVPYMIGSTSANGSVAGPIGGPLAGFNFTAGPVVLGVEADAGLAAANGSIPAPALDSTTQVFNFALNWDAHVRGRVGIPVGTVLPFIAGGAAFAGLHWTGPLGGTASGTFTGLTLGTGVDAQLTPAILGRAEVLYDSFGSHSYSAYPAYTIGLNTWTVRGAVIFKLP